MTQRLTSGVDLALIELNAGLLDGVRDRLRGHKQIISSQARIMIGNWCGMQLLIASPTLPNQLSQFMESVQLAHQPEAMVGFKVFGETQGDSKEGTLFSLRDLVQGNSRLIEQLIKDLQQSHDVDSYLYPDGLLVIGAYVSDGKMFEQRNFANRIGRLAGKLLKQPKDILGLPKAVSARLTIQNEIANQLEWLLKRYGAESISG